MALAYTAPTWTDGSGTGISASQLQALCNCVEGLVQGSDKAIHSFVMSGQTITVTYADGTQETFTATGLKGISSITKTGTVGLVDTYTITYTDGTTATFNVTNGEQGATGPEGPEGPEGPQGPAGADGADGQDGADGVSPEVTITTITGGHQVEITDADHPSGQTFDVMDGTVPITKYTQTLSAGSTSVTFSNVTTTANSIIEVATSVAGLEYNAISNSGNSYTVTFDAQSSAVTVYLIVTEVA